MEQPVSARNHQSLMGVLHFRRSSVYIPFPPGWQPGTFVARTHSNSGTDKNKIIILIYIYICILNFVNSEALK